MPTDFICGVNGVDACPGHNLSTERCERLDVGRILANHLADRVPPEIKDALEQKIKNAKPGDAIPVTNAEFKQLCDPKYKALHEEPPYRNARVVDVGSEGINNLLFEEGTSESVVMTLRTGQKPILHWILSRAQWKALQSIVYQL